MRISLSLSWGCPIREVAQLHAGGIALVIIITAIVIIITAIVIIITAIVIIITAIVIVITAIVIIIITALVVIIITAIVIIIDISNSCIFQGHWEELGLKSGRAGGEQ